MDESNILLEEMVLILPYIAVLVCNVFYFQSSPAVQGVDLHSQNTDSIMRCF